MKHVAIFLPPCASQIRRRNPKMILEIPRMVIMGLVGRGRYGSRGGFGSSQFLVQLPLMRLLFYLGSEFDIMSL